MGNLPALWAVPKCRQTHKAFDRFQTVWSNGMSIGGGGNCELMPVNLYEMKPLKQHVIRKDVESECLC